VRTTPFVAPAAAIAGSASARSRTAYFKVSLVARQDARGPRTVCKLPPERWFERLVPTEPAYPMHPNAKGEASIAKSAIAVLSRPGAGTLAAPPATQTTRSRRGPDRARAWPVAPGSATRT